MKFLVPETIEVRSQGKNAAIKTLQKKRMETFLITFYSTQKQINIFGIDQPNLGLKKK